ncbi:MAG: septum formation protein Maf [Deltaproteobacteria bacterium]|nr:septum formation protein Maf [Deltaproteobacteria bacterium]
MKKEKIILASSSPRRKALLKNLVERFDIHPAEVDERIKGGESPVEHTRRLATEKARKAGEGRDSGYIIGADTVVVIDGDILGKPADRNAARRMLSTLSARTHTVITAFSILNARTKKSVSKAVESRVTFRRLGKKEIEDYIETEEPFDKAGAYGAEATGPQIYRENRGFVHKRCGIAH